MNHANNDIGRNSDHETVSEDCDDGNDDVFAADFVDETKHPSCLRCGIVGIPVKMHAFAECIRASEPGNHFVEITKETENQCGYHNRPEDFILSDQFAS